MTRPVIEHGTYACIIHGGLDSLVLVLIYTKLQNDGASLVFDSQGCFSDNVPLLPVSPRRTALLALWSVLTCDNTAIVSPVSHTVTLRGWSATCKYLLLEGTGKRERTLFTERNSNPRPRRACSELPSNNYISHSWWILKKERVARLLRGPSGTQGPFGMRQTIVSN